MIKRRTIPQLQLRLTEMAYENDLPELLDIVEELYRRKPARRAPPQQRGIATAEMRATIAADVAAHPNDTYETIAQRHGVNVGRVSEAFAGHR